MSDTICGHEREALRWALRQWIEDSVFTRTGPLDAILTTDESSSIHDANDTSKLAAIIAELMRERGIVDGAKHTSDVPAAYVADLGGALLVVLWPRVGCSIGHRFTMPQARAFALALLDAPADADVEQMIREAS